MHRLKHSKKKQVSAHNILYRTTGILLVLTLFSVWLLCGLSAKYTVSDDIGDSARVAKSVDIKVLEHNVELITDANDAVQKDSVYKLLTDSKNEVEGYEYKVVLPGVDIPKDPFVRIEGESEVTFELYVKIVENNVPDTVTYDVITDDWTETSAGSNTYKYKDVIDSEVDDIYILKDNKVKVSENYEGETFSLTFEAWLAQVD